MYPRDRLPWTAVADVGCARNALADSVVEDKYPVGAGRGFDQPFRFRIVDGLDLVFVIEVLYRTVLPNQGEPFPIQR
jgi:hypothetical protein